MNQQNNLDSVHDGIIGILDHVQQYHGRAATQRLLSRIQNTFDSGSSSSITAEGKGTARELPDQSDAEVSYEEFIGKGGYSLVDKNIYATVRRGTYPVVAFGIEFIDQNTPILKFLLNIDETFYEKPVTLGHLARYSAEHKPLFGQKSGFTFILSVAPSTPNVEKLVNDLATIGARELAEAIVRISRHNNGIRDDVPQATLVPLTDYERDNLPTIPNVDFWYGDRGDGLIRIEPAGRDGYAFFTRHQAVEVNARNVEVTKRLAPGPTSGLIEVWTLLVTPHASHVGVSLHAVMSLTEDDPRRAEYLPLIDVFIQQTLEHAQRQPKQL